MTPADFPPAWRDTALHVFACSDFVAQSFTRDAELWTDLSRHDALRSERRPGGRNCWPRVRRPEAPFDEAELQRWFRLWRRREMVRIAWRDLSGAATLAETLEDLTAFADDAVTLAVDCAWQMTAARYGKARGADGRNMPLVVIGMGKLGGRELNFSSDIDLVFLFPEYGETQHTSPVSHDEFFIRLGQQMLRLLSTTTVDGQVFRVDMRLRPFGDSGPLACGFSSFEDYLLQHGRDWERYAWIKARAITGSEAYQSLYEEAVRPFVYRRYLDFGVFESLREMKQLIEKQIARKDLVDHIKLGAGGIREIEFIVQSLQLIRGGQDRRLQNPRLLEVLPQLARNRLLQSQVVDELTAAYRYLRVLENRLQMIRDLQTHTLPADELTQAKLARAMGEADWAALRSRLAKHLELVEREFQALVFAPLNQRDQLPQASSAASELAQIWDDSANLVTLQQLFEARGFSDIKELALLLHDFRSSALVRRQDVNGLRRLQTLLPQLLESLGGEDAHLVMVRRMLRVIEAIGGRSAYFALLNENPVARRRFVDVCRGGDFLVAQLAAHPLLLDELLDERALAEPPGRADLAADLDDRLARVEGEEAARLVETLNQFKRAAVFRVAIADLTGSLPLMRVSDRLTDIAELVIEKAMQQAWAQITLQYGVPKCRDTADGPLRDVRICAIGYGKLGGIELGYSSDLDLVFLHDSVGAHQETDADRPLDNQIFLVRLAQRIVHILSVHSIAGRLYDVDVRLRPSGKGGMLITQIDAFKDYQHSEAWTWEHQALLHARSVAGSGLLRDRFEEMRRKILCDYVKRDTLHDEVRSMRERMRKELSKSKDGQFDLKQDPGGIADIEFLAQYWALREAQKHPAVVMFSDTIRELETLASGALVPQATVDVLTAAYRAYRERGHHRSLRDETTVISDSEFTGERAAVIGIWNETFNDGV